MAIIPENLASLDGDYEIKESLLQLVRGGIGLDDVLIILGVKRDKVVRWIKMTRFLMKRL